MLKDNEKQTLYYFEKIKELFYENSLIFLLKRTGMIIII